VCLSAFVLLAFFPQFCAARLDGVNRQGFGPKTERQHSVVEAFLHAWKGYQEHCWGKDELLPVSKRCSSEMFKGIGAQIIDALDSLLLMGLQKQYLEALGWLLQNFDAAIDEKVSVFETSIRILGGLLSAHFLSDNPDLLRYANDMGQRLLKTQSPEKETPRGWRREGQ